MKPAIIVVDMLKDNLKESARNPLYGEGKAIIPNLQRLLKESRKRKFPIVFACDSFLEGDFIFQGRTKIHSLQGTEGAEVIEDLKTESQDTILRKRHFSAFFGTDLDKRLRKQGIDTIVVTGMTTEVCVLSTAMDGLCYSFYVILLEDCTASRSKERRRACLNLYRDTSLHPLLRVMTLEEFLKKTSSLE